MTTAPQKSNVNIIFGAMTIGKPGIPLLPRPALV
jgi:hypothetical protein